MQKLGISHLYLSPILESRPGSSHGYDSIDPQQVSEERGGERGLDRLLRRISKMKGVEGVILDVVPNHVAAHWSNPYWWDVLKNGRQSTYWKYFDIRPRKPDDYRVVLPVLGRSRRAVLAAGELRLEYSQGEFVIRYWENRFPVQEKSNLKILQELRIDSPEKAKTASQKLSDLPLKFLENLLKEQNYVLEDWRLGSREINYRRFFDISDLAAVRIEEPEVFEWSHAKLKQLINKYPQIHGLRIDHIDGLKDPESYLKRLQTISPYVWVEKILGEGESLPESWQTDGTTGYEFSNVSARLFVSLSGLLHLHSHYIRNIDKRWARFHDCVYESKREILESHFVSEINFLVDEFYNLVGRTEPRMKFRKEDLCEALVELTCSLKVYRTYRKSLEPFDSNWLKEAFAEVEGRGLVHSRPTLDWLRKILMESRADSEIFEAIKKWEQLTGPVMAKGLEDTALYRYFPLLSLNVVGGEPDWMGDGAIEFHGYNQDRLRKYPLGLSTTSTHDTKRSEDVRSRIHVLSEVFEEWIQFFEKWSSKKSIAPDLKGRLQPDVYTKYMIFETLLGTWPTSSKIDKRFIERMKNYFIKAVREAKSETSWIEPNPAYEESLQIYVENLLRPRNSTTQTFLRELSQLAGKCMFYGAFNSLSLLTLKALSPGVPDFYQGGEFWDCSLVDPDNRRPVDYKKRRQALERLEQKSHDPIRLRIDLLKRWRSGEIKLWTMKKLLELRAENPALFIRGDYIVLEVQGEYRDHFIGFLRKLHNHWVLALVPRLLASKVPVSPWLEIKNGALMAVEFKLPLEAPRNWVHLFSRETVKLDGVFRAEDVFHGWPVAVLASRTN